MAVGETKADTSYLEAEMGGACMPNGDRAQRLISLGAHFNLTTPSAHTLGPLRADEKNTNNNRFIIYN